MFPVFFIDQYINFVENLCMLKKIFVIKKSLPVQYLFSFLLTIGISACCFYFSAVLDYRITALLLLMTVSLLAILFEILPVLVMALLSGLILNFFLYSAHIYFSHYKRRGYIIVFYLFISGLIECLFYV